MWEVQSVPSICTLCPVGCNTTLDMRHNKLMRVMPRENAAVNDIWICDKGRFGHRFIESTDRLTTPLVRRDGALVPASWQEALGLVAEKFAAIQSAAGGAALGGLAGDHLANEDLFIFQRLFREVLNSNNLDYRTGTPGEQPPMMLGHSLAWVPVQPDGTGRRHYRAGGGGRPGRRSTTLYAAAASHCGAGGQAVCCQCPPNQT
ncbi:MAG: molybdopterin-dependent oxidoreductase [Chloroflexaceae bacterium]|nr:molybdopterin-dependent oxidoreductase [Chloroflexaceae bacterium]